MKPWIHAQNSAKRFGGVEEDYLAIHDWFDSSKAVFPDMRHRALYHHSHGIYLAEKLFGHNLQNRDNQRVSVRDVGEWHCIEDLGRIPTVQDYLAEMPFYNWLGGSKKKKRVTSVDEMVSSINEQGAEWVKEARQIIPSISFSFRPTHDHTEEADLGGHKERIVD